MRHCQNYDGFTAGDRDPLLSRPAYFNFHGLADTRRKTLTFKTFDFPPE